MALTEGMQAKFIRDLCSIHGIREILLICKHKQHCISQLILYEKSKYDIHYFQAKPQRNDELMADKVHQPKIVWETC